MVSSKYFIIGFSLFIFIVIPAHPADGGLLNIKMDLSTTVGPDDVKVRIDATNHGNEPAFEVRAVLHAFDQNLESRTLKRLEVEQTSSFEFRFTVPADKKGAFALVGELLFHDSGQHPFSTLACTLLKIGDKIPSGLSGFAPEHLNVEKKNLPIRVINAASRTREVVARIYLPWSLDADRKQKKISLSPRGYTTVNFSINSRLGLNDATYPVYCILAFEEEGRNQAVIVRAAVQIVGRKNWFVRTRRRWLEGLIVVLAGWAIILLVGKGKGEERTV